MHWQTTECSGEEAARWAMTFGKTWDALPAAMRGTILIVPAGERARIYLSNPAWTRGTPEGVLPGWTECDPPKFGQLA